MEKINLVELLKNCPKGMELDCTAYNDVTFLHVDESQNRCYFKVEPADTFWTTCYGHLNYSPKAKCVIFPKGETTWEGFVPPCKFKDGDIVATTTGNWIGITTGGDSGEFMPTYCVVKSNGEFEAYFDYKEIWQFNRFATEEEKQKLFDAIKANGYRWNAENKTLEKLIIPKFKVGDRIRSVISLSYYTIVDIEDDQYVIKPDAPEKFPYHIDFSLETNYELVHKFDITTLKPFESKVLVRDSEAEEWKPAIWGYYDSDETYDYPYEVVGGIGFSMCIPYEENKHLRGKTDDCSSFYKTWE